METMLSAMELRTNLTHCHSTNWITDLCVGIDKPVPSSRHLQFPETLDPSEIVLPPNSAPSGVMSDRPSRVTVPLMGNLEIDGKFRCPVISAVKAGE